ncbi:hypothetical protein [Xanthomonas medicagonis]|uniref:hypothetical protein n=1 Tax=Xanthomonas medicagonis TaxID=3160841 RepID=UPI00351467EB
MGTSSCLPMARADAADEHGERRISLPATRIFPCLKVGCGGKPRVDVVAQLRAAR